LTHLLSELCRAPVPEFPPYPSPSPPAKVSPLLLLLISFCSSIMESRVLVVPPSPLFIHIVRDSVIPFATSGSLYSPHSTNSTLFSFPDAFPLSGKNRANPAVTLFVSASCPIPLTGAPLRFEGGLSGCLFRCVSSGFSFSPPIDLAFLPLIHQRHFQPKASHMLLLFRFQESQRASLDLTSYPLSSLSFPSPFRGGQIPSLLFFLLRIYEGAVGTVPHFLLVLWPFSSAFEEEASLVPRTSLCPPLLRNVD